MLDNQALGCNLCGACSKVSNLVILEAINWIQQTGQNSSASPFWDSKLKPLRCFWKNRSGKVNWDLRSGTHTASPTMSTICFTNYIKETNRVYAHIRHNFLRSILNPALKFLRIFYSQNFKFIHTSYRLG